MNGLAFDSLSRFAAAAIPQRAEKSEPGMTRLVPRGSSVTAASKSRCKKRARRRCQEQVESCITGLTSRCNGDPDCVATAQRCCPVLKNCDAKGFITCFVLE
jgi:hypothetical protein